MVVFYVCVNGCIVELYVMVVFYVCVNGCITRYQIIVHLLNNIYQYVNGMWGMCLESISDSNLLKSRFHIHFSRLVKIPNF